MIWFVIFGMALVTYFNRVVFLLKGFEYKPSEKVRSFLAFSGLAVLTAIWTPIVFQVDYSAGGGVVSGIDYLVASSLAAALSLMKVHSLLVVVVSTVSFFVLRSFGF